LRLTSEDTLVRYLTIATLLAAGLILADEAQACVSIPGDMRVISRGMDAKSTSKADKARLKRLLAVMHANRGRDARQVSRYQAASIKALAILGENTIVPHDASKYPPPAPGTSKGAFLGC
jgi:hypothetical protein